MIKNDLDEMIATYSNLPSGYSSLSQEEKDEKLRIGGKITKKVVAVKVMNDFESAKANGIKETLRFILRYIFKNQTTVSMFNDLKSGDFGINGPLQAILAILFLPISAPLCAGGIVAEFGIRGVQLAQRLLSAPKIAEILKKNGIYEKSMEALELFYNYDDYPIPTFDYMNVTESFLGNRNRRV